MFPCEHHAYNPIPEPSRLSCLILINPQLLLRKHVTSHLISETAFQFKTCTSLANRSISALARIFPIYAFSVAIVSVLISAVWVWNKTKADLNALITNCVVVLYYCLLLQIVCNSISRRPFGKEWLLASHFKKISKRLNNECFSIQTVFISKTMNLL